MRMIPTQIHTGSYMWATTEAYDPSTQEEGVVSFPDSPYMPSCLVVRGAVPVLLVQARVWSVVVFIGTQI